MIGLVQWFLVIPIAGYLLATVVCAGDLRTLRTALAVLGCWFIFAVGYATDALSIGLWLLGMTATIAATLTAHTARPFRFYRHPTDRRPHQPPPGPPALSNADLQRIAQQARHRSQQGGFL